jgi:DNA-binding NtrC family response regulator
MVEAQAPAPAVAMPAGRERILFVDDELLIVRMGQRALGRLGYSVTGLTDPEEALQAFKDAPDSFDLVITDQTMPAMTGDALIAALREISPGLPAILCTGYSPSMNADEARRRGIEAFLMKPLEADDLGRAVATVLARARSSGVAAAALST